MFRLLIVDDEPYIVESLAEMLMMHDLPFKEIKIAYSAAQALSFIEEATFDIIIADIRMPEMDGLEFFERVKSYWSLTKLVFLTGYSDFQYAQKAMKLGASDYLLKPADDEEVILCLKRVIQELEQGLEQMMALERAKDQVITALPVLQSELFKYILHIRENIDLEVLKSKFKQFEYPFSPEKKITTVIFRIDEWEERFNPDDEPLIQFTVQNMVNDILESTCFLMSFRYEEGLVVILMQPKEEIDAEHVLFILKGRLAEAQDTIYRVLGVTVSFGFASKFFDWKSLYMEFSNLLLCIKQSLGIGMQIISQPNKHTINSLSLNESLAEIKIIIQNRDVLEFEKYMNTIFANNDNSSPGSKENSAFMFINISSYLLNVILQYNLTSLLEPLVLESMTNLYKHKNFDSIIRLFVDTFKKIVNALDNFNSHHSQTIIEQVKVYISEHLSEIISLDELSRKVFLNPSYLSKIFHQTQGEQLIAYITRKKMEHAKQLLLSSSFKIHEISEKIGFMNPNYFAKVFRKTYRMSPQDFRIFYSMQ